MSTRSKPRVLFVGEAVTLAHVARPMVLAGGLDPDRYEIHFACARFNPRLFGDLPFRHWPIESVPPDRFLRSLSTGRRCYTHGVLERYVRQDLDLLDAVRPDVVVGDFRLSLAVSAPLAGVPHVAVVNAHWSPHAPARFPLPETPIARLLGVGPASALFRAVQPLIFALHARPFNQLRKAHGLPPLGTLRHVYTAGDHVLYPDVPELVPTRQPPPTHRYIGPVIWSPEVPTPDWWDRIPADRPCVYVTLGSSGQVGVLPTLLSTLARKPVNVLLATAARAPACHVPPNVWAAEYLPGREAARRSVLVVCNGGSATVYQALAEGTPVLGIVSNMDQHLTMAYVEAAGAGLLLRAERATPHRIAAAVSRLLEEPAFRRQARAVSRWFARYPAARCFAAWMADFLRGGITA